MATHLFLLAPAPTAEMRLAAFPRGDEALDAAAASRAGELLGRLRYSDRQIVSPAAAARGTAAALGLSPSVEAALLDCNYGRWRGETLADIEQREPEAAEAWISDPDAAPHGGESLTAFIARIEGWLHEIASLSGVTLAIAPAAVIRAAVVAAIEAPARSFWRLDIAPLSVTRLSGHGGQWRLVGLGPL